MCAYIQSSINICTSLQSFKKVGLKQLPQWLQLFNKAIPPHAKEIFINSDTTESFGVLGFTLACRELCSIQCLQYHILAIFFYFNLFGCHCSLDFQLPHHCWSIFSAPCVPPKFFFSAPCVPPKFFFSASCVPPKFLKSSS